MALALDDQIDFCEALVDNALAAYESLAEFVRQAWHVLEPTTDLVWNWHIDVICDYLERVTFGLCNRLIINVPPGHMKSRLVSVFWPAWLWLQDPSKRMICLSAVDDVVKRDAINCRDLVTSDWYESIKAVLEIDWYFAKDQNEKLNYKNSETGFRNCFTARSKIVGARADVFLIDDPYDVSEVLFGGATLINKRMHEIRDRFDNVWYSRVNNPKESAFVLIMQRVHTEDLSGYLEKSGQWDVVSFDSYYVPENAIDEDQRTRSGELLFPQRFDNEVLDDYKRKLGRHFDAQFRQLPRAPGGNIIKEGWLTTRWRSLPFSGAGKFAWFIDPKMGSKDPASSCATIGLFFQPFKEPAKIYLIDWYRGRWNIPEQAQILHALAQDDIWRKASAKIIENAGGGKGVFDLCVGFIPGLTLVSPNEHIKGDVASRLEICSPFFASHNIILPHDDLDMCQRTGFQFPLLPDLTDLPDDVGTQIDELVAELTTIPNHPTDDLGAIFCMAIEHFLLGERDDKESRAQSFLERYTKRRYA